MTDITTLSDRELLELAAEAAGIKHVGEERDKDGNIRLGAWSRKFKPKGRQVSEFVG